MRIELIEPGVCVPVFGDQPGLQSPFHLSPGTNITAIKYFNNTYRHLGQARRTHSNYDANYHAIGRGDVCASPLISALLCVVRQMAQWTGLIAYDTDPF